MVSLIVDWVNSQLLLDPQLTETSLDKVREQTHTFKETNLFTQDLSSGFVLGALLHRFNQLPGYERLRRHESPDAKIENFLLLEPALSSLGVKFDSLTAGELMDAAPGSAASVLYQTKMALESLTKNPVAQRPVDGAQPYPNLPHRLPKPRYDASRARRFEDMIRRRAQNPNTVMMNKHLEKRHFIKQLSDQVENVVVPSKTDRRHRDRTSAKGKVEVPARPSTDSTPKGGDDNCATRRIASMKTKATAAQSDRERKALEKKRRKILLARKSARLAATVAEDLDNFEQKIQIDEAPAPAIFLPLIHVPDPTDAGQSMIALDKQQMKFEFKAQSEQIRNEKIERESQHKLQAKNYLKLLSDHEKSMRKEAEEERIREMVEASESHKSQFEVDIEERLALIEKYKARFAESRKFRELQYSERQVVDDESNARRDDVVFASDVEAYTRRLQRHRRHVEDIYGNKRRAQSLQTVNMCRYLIDGIIAVSTEIARLRSVQHPTFDRMLFRPLFLKKCVVDDRAEPAIHDALRLLARTNQNLCLAESPPIIEIAAARDIYNEWSRDGEEVVSMMTTAAESDGPAPPSRVSNEIACEILDEFDLDEYLLNAPPVWGLSKRLADVELSSIDDSVAVVEFLKKPSAVDVDEDIEKLSGFEEYGACADAKRAAGVAAVAKLGPSTPSVFHALGDAIIEVRRQSRYANVSPPTKTQPPVFPVRICFAGPAFSGKSEQATKLAFRFHLKVLSVAALIREALETAEKIGLGREKATEDGILSFGRLGKEAAVAMREGMSVPDHVCAELVSAGITALAEMNERLLIAGDEPYHGWVLEDFPLTATQAAALEFVLTGYDGSKQPSRRNWASKLAEPSPIPEPAWPGMSPRSTEKHVKSGVDFVFIMNTSTDCILRRSLGRRVASEATGTTNVESKGEFHLDWNCPLTPCKASLEAVQDASRPSPGIPFQIVACNTAASNLRSFLARFGTLRDIFQPQGLMPDGVFDLIFPEVDRLVARLAAEEASKVEEQSRKEMARQKTLVALASALDAAKAQASAATAHASSCSVEEASAEVRDARAAAALAAEDGVVRLIAATKEAEVSMTENPVEEEVNDAVETMLLPRQLATVIASCWDAAEDAFSRGTKAVFRAMRIDRRRLECSHYSLRENFCNFLSRPENERQNLLTDFTNDFNKMPRAMRVEDETKAELHLRIEEMRSSMWRVSEVRRDEAMAVLDALSTDMSSDLNAKAVIRYHAALIQLEVDRTHAAIMLLHDFYHTTSPRDSGVEDPNAGGVKVPLEKHGRLARCIANQSSDSSKKGDKNADGRQPLPPLVAQDMFSDDVPEEEKTRGVGNKKGGKTADEQFEIVIKAALDFAAKWSPPSDVASHQELDVAVWHQAALLRARIDRLRAANRCAVVSLQSKADDLLSELRNWLNNRVAAELAVVEKVVERCQQAVEQEQLLEQRWVVHGVVLHIDTDARLVQAHECAEWLQHPRAHQLLLHTHIRDRLPEPPPPPEVMELPLRIFATHQLNRIRTALLLVAGCQESADDAAYVSHDTLMEVFERLSLDLTALPLQWRPPKHNTGHYVRMLITALDPDQKKGCTNVAGILAYLASISAND